MINPFTPDAPFTYPCKHQKTLQLSDVFKGQKKGALETNELTSNRMMCLPVTTKKTTITLVINLNLYVFCSVNS